MLVWLVDCYLRLFLALAYLIHWIFAHWALLNFDVVFFVFIVCGFIVWFKSVGDILPKQALLSCCFFIVGLAG